MIPTKVIDNRVFTLEEEGMSFFAAKNKAQALRRLSRIPAHGNLRPLRARVLRYKGHWAVWVRQPSSL